MTICTHDRVNYFGEIDKDWMKMNHVGQIATDCWRDIPNHFDNTVLDEFIVMPNHIHGILVIKGNHFLTGDNQNVGNNDRYSLRRPRNMQLLPKVISQYKSSVTRRLRKQFINHPFRWQCSFYDHVIRNDESLDDIRAYIKNNPQNWALDEENPVNRTT